MAWWDGKFSGVLPPSAPTAPASAFFPLAKKVAVPRYLTAVENAALARKRGRTPPASIPSCGVPNSGCCIGYLRKGDKGTRWHCGVDLAAKAGDPVIACEDGTIVRFRNFGKASGNTWALFVDHGSYIINYGEVDKVLPNGLKEGTAVKAGSQIAVIGLMDSGNSMLHFEMYSSGLKGYWTNKFATGNQSWSTGSSPPIYLLNPTPYLQSLLLAGTARVEPIDLSACR